MANEKSFRSVIAPDVARILEAEGFLTPAHNNKRKLSLLLIQYPPLFLLNELTPKFDQETVDYVELPEVLESIESYETLGFTREVATGLWNCYVNRKDNHHCHFDFFDWAEYRINEMCAHVEDAEGVDDDWEACLDSLGIKESLKRSIVDPQFDDIRFTETCKYWVSDSIGMAWRSLQDMNSRIRSSSVYKAIYDVHQRRMSSSLEESTSSLSGSLGRLTPILEDPES